jgi:hypothetical protein
MPGLYREAHFLHYKINHSFYYSNVIIDNNTYIDQQNVHLIENKHYPQHNIQISHFQVDTVLPYFLSQKK